MMKVYVSIKLMVTIPKLRYHALGAYVKSVYFVTGVDRNSPNYTYLKTLPKALQTQALTVLPSNLVWFGRFGSVGMVCLVWFGWFSLSAYSA